MKVIYTISPDHLKALVKETSEYSFSLVGYRDIKEAISKLYMCNAKDILGYMYVADEMPEYKHMHILLKKIDLSLDKPKVFIIAVKSGESFEEFQEEYQGSKVKVKVIKGYEVLTDLIIKNIVLDILISQETPYLEYKETELNPGIKPTYLKYKSIIDKRLLMILEPVRTQPTVEDTIRYDNVLGKLNNKEGINGKLRVAYIYAHFGEEKDLSKYDDDNRFVMIRVLQNIIKEVASDARKVKN